MHTAKTRLLILSCLLVFLMPAPVSAHEARTILILDTDMATDDVRAIALLACADRVRLLAAVTSDGGCAPDEGLRNLLRVLSFLGAGQVPLGMGTQKFQSSPPFRPMCDILSRAPLPTVEDAGTPREAEALILSALQGSPEKVTYVCLGPLTNLAGALRKMPSAQAHIERVLYSGSPPRKTDPSWNTARDLEAANEVFRSGIPVYAFHLDDDGVLRFDTDLYHGIQGLDSKAVRLISLLYSQDEMQELLLQGHFRAWDETVALYLIDPSLAGFEKLPGTGNVFLLTRWDGEAARQAYTAVLAEAETPGFPPRVPVLLAAYPAHPEDFLEDVRPLVEAIIARHGVEEWKAALLTNELHRHLGIYSLLGAKMGIRAREILGAGLDDLKVESHAGLKPPLSCMTDGLQVATGASLGRGTIRVDQKDTFPGATFQYGTKKLSLRLKQDVQAGIRKDLHKEVERYGGVTPEYFHHIRELSLKYWLELDRTKIFEERFEQ
jgi:pyrimidine-specific ribonucleoside hydrolase